MIRKHETSPTQIVLTTERLILRTWQPADVNVMTEINTDPLVMEHFPALQDRHKTLKLFEHINQHFAEHGYALYAVELKNAHAFIGFVGLNHPPFEIPHFTPESLPVVEIGWRLSARHWGMGYASEAASAVLEHAFTTLKLDEIISFTVPANLKSQRVMEKIGMRHSIADDFDHPNLTDSSPLKQHVLYRITRHDYDGIQKDKI